MSFPVSSMKGPKGYNSFSTLNPQQGQLLQQLLGQLIGQGGQGGLGNQSFNYLSELLSNSPESFEKFSAPYMRQFNEQILPGIAERFAGLGAGSQSSSAFQQALGQASTGLQENLAALRGQLQLQALPQALNSLQSLLGMSTFGLAPKPQSFGKQFGLNLASGLGQGIGTLPALLI